MTNINKRYIRLNSVGCFLDTKNDLVFPIDLKKNHNYELNKIKNAVHLNDCCNEWFDSLDSNDFKLLKKIYNYK